MIEKTFRIGNELSELGRLAEQIEALELPPAKAFNLNLILDELVTNTISYGYAEGEPGWIEITVIVKDGTVALRIRDNGRRFDPTQKAEPDLDIPLEEKPIGGLGIHLVRKLSTRFAYRRDGDVNETEIVMK